MSSNNNNMKGCGKNEKSNEEVIREMQEQSKRTGRPVITEVSENVTVYDFSPQDEITSESFETSKGDGRIGDLQSRVDHYIQEGMEVNDAAKAAYRDVAEAYENDAASMDEVQTAVQELETYVEDKGGDFQAVARELETEVNEVLERTAEASDRIENVYNDLLG